ncbi:MULTISPECIES: HAMP domain-containing sensor histidine kinase [unclassified Streptomyces]|uniref:HAMP domain-containing sensor histidine kinase n=1 Tax=unclassified Streptomyces TaxID=2593676 RepID=UPI0009BDF9F1|nr:HAMP domain-containing sensor histidine kinase [Streptomyces sp. M41(2017)]OQQ17076.1 two-component sensor histidine kinase [Streptomyces sp. M41(2017)]
MKRLFRRFRSLPLRSRLALLVAAAVAFAVAAVSVTCWFIVQGKLYDELNNELQSSANRPQGGKLVSTISNCNGSEVDPSGQSPTDAGGFRAQFESYLQVVTADGESCVASVSPGKIEVAGSDTDFAKNPVAGHGTFRDGTDTKGNPVRVLTVPLMISNPDGTTTIIKDAATMYAVPLKGTNATLNELALVLLLVGGIGVLGAGAAGLWVARAGLRPVDKLTETVEHVARTEDLTVRIPVEGNDEIARLSESFNSMTASLASSRELQQQLIADAGHELRTPLTSLRTNIELLTRSEETGRPIPPADRKALLASVTAQMTELAALIGDLQTLSRSDEAHAGDRVEVVALQDTVEAALRRARLRGPELTITADLEPWFVRAEPSALERAIVNILDNAVKFSPPGGTVDVRLHAGELSVRDHGPGIPTDELPHVFDRFWRSPDARALPGSGLGLSIVARTVQQAGGEVSLRPAEDGGTIATVRLPGAPAAPPELP